MSTSAFLWRYARRYTAWMGVALLSSTLAAVSLVAVASLARPIFKEILLTDQVPVLLEPIDEAAGQAEEKSWFGSLQDTLDLQAALDRAYEGLKRKLGVTGDRVLYFLPPLFVFVALLRSLAIFSNGYAFQRIGLGATNDMRNDLYGRILGHSSRFFSRHPSGELVSRVVNDVSVLQNAVSTRLLDLAQETLTLLGLVWMLLSIHLPLALVCLVGAPAFVYPIARFGRGMRRTSHRSQEVMGEIAGLVNEGVRGHRVVKAFGMEAFEHARFREATRRHLRVNLRAQLLAHGSGPVVEALAVVGSAALLVYFGRVIRAGELEASELVRFLLILIMMYDPIRKLNKVNLVVQQALAAVHRVAAVMSIPVDVVEREGAIRVESIREAIGFESISFSYGREPVLCDLDLEIAVGEVVAFVGPSGAGKSTLVNLLPRFFDPDRGQVTIDGVNIRDLTLASLRRLVAVVEQEPVLFNDTVRANIAYGRSDVALSRVAAAAEAAFADEFVERLPQGYETPIGELGGELSGGQRQRLAIARALFKDAPILILDEATSQLDSESESLVQKALANLMAGRTTLVVAHRLATIVGADRIVVMESGRIVEIGSHAALLERDGLYRRLYDLQFQA